MKVSTPSISWHNRERISSVDFQRSPFPNHKMRLASAGDDKHVVIWQVIKSEEDQGKCRLLCLADLCRHQNSVNVVRWSKDGKILASGDTDSAVYLWHFQDKPAAPDIFNDEPDAEGEPSEETEHWGVLKVLRGHLQDVVSLDWSACGNFLVSSSTDNTAIVFDVNKGAKLKILSEHKGWVNGVTYDPLGKYIASICSDRVLRIYDTKSYKNAYKTYKCKISLPDGEGEEKTVRLFHDDTFQSFYRRADFSPDGQLLAVPSGVLEIEQEAKIPHCTYVFSRANFSRPALYLPNKEFSVAVRFSPILYELRPVLNPDRPEDDNNNPLPWEKYKTLFALPYRMIYAVATQNTVLFYDTQQIIPFARVSKIHYIGLTDLSWSSDGLSCVVSSTDGYASIIEFKKNELGQVYEPVGMVSSQNVTDQVASKCVVTEKEKANLPIKRSNTSSPAPSVVPAKKSPTEKVVGSKIAVENCFSDESIKTAKEIPVKRVPKDEPKEVKKTESGATKTPEDAPKKEPKRAQLVTLSAPAKTQEAPKKEAKRAQLITLSEPSKSEAPKKETKRAQLITLSEPPKNETPQNDDDEDEEDLKLVLEEDKTTDCDVQPTTPTAPKGRRVQLVTLSKP